jgi:putative peptidoglycan lipid II flippase
MRHPGLRKVVRNMGPMVLGLSLVQINVVIDQEMAIYLVERDGANTLIYLANRLLLFPQALIGTALGTAVFPLLSLLGGRRDHESMAEVLDQALSVSLFLAIPATAGLLALAPDLIEVMYRHGQFTSDDSREAAWVVRALICGLPFMTLNQILVRACYARGNTRTPVRISVLLMFANLGLNLVLAKPLGAAGLALSTSLCAAANTLLLWWPLRIRWTGSVLGLTSRRTLLSTAGMMVIIWALSGSLSSLAGGSRWYQGLFLVALPIVLGAAGYFACNHLLGGDELTRLLLKRRPPRP